ncbi:MAG: sugar phosphate isomerase/epimerase [Solirubrobacterales bacterium]|nr:sugar phosphate isomerase/epimerase [Solirubrobacterales bacterium]
MRLDSDVNNRYKMLGREFGTLQTPVAPRGWECGDACVRVGLFTDGLEHLDFAGVLAWCAERKIRDLELGVGGYSPVPHVDVPRLLADPGARAELLDRVHGAGAAIVALNVSGNPLHPDRRIGAVHDRHLRDSLRLAALLDVDRVVAMSGCPGSPGNDAWPVFAGGAWLPDMEGLVDWQWEKRLWPHWRELSEWAAREASGVAICLELHPGTSVYNAASYLRLREAAGDNVRVNLDPSHFWWQGIDPVRTIQELGDAVAFVHGKDTLIHPDRVALHGVLDFRWPGPPDTTPWHFCAVGEGRPEEEWAALIDALAAAGYDGVISIEQEDPRYGPEEGVERSLAGLHRALARAPAG